LGSTADMGRFNRFDALSLWQFVTLENVRNNEPDLTNRQFVIFTTVYLIDGTHTVRSLAKRLDVTKAVITRALDTLGRYGFVTRQRDPSDKRSIVIQRTARGSIYLQRFGDQICNQIKSYTQKNTP